MECKEKLKRLERLDGNPSLPLPPKASLDARKYNPTFPTIPSFPPFPFSLRGD